MYPVWSAHERGPTRVLAFEQDVLFLVKIYKILYNYDVSSEYHVRLAQVCRQIMVLAGTCILALNSLMQGYIFPYILSFSENRQGIMVINIAQMAVMRTTNTLFGQHMFAGRSGCSMLPIARHFYIYGLQEVHTIPCSSHAEVYADQDIPSELY